jgi:hypothetical protein
MLEIGSSAIADIIEKQKNCLKWKTSKINFLN